MATWAFYSNANLTSALTELSCTQTVSTFHVYFGSTTSGVKLVPQTTGATGIHVNCADSATGGHAITAIKMAATTGDLSSATAGADFDLGAQVLGGVANAESWYIQVTDAVGDGVKSTELSLSIDPCYQQAT